MSPKVALPDYDRRSLTPGVVHIGVGGFHRAHQAVYFDDLAAAGVGYQWGITGVGLHSSSVGTALAAQDCLWTVEERGREASHSRVVGVMTDWLHGATQPRAVLDALSSPQTRLVTLTITGDGYNLDPVGAFRCDDPAVARDLARPSRPDCVFGYLVEALRRRRQRGIGPFTVLSCDNIPNNGHATRTMVVSFARLRDAGLADWIAEHVTFPNSVVDRITPETTCADRSDIERTVGIVDRCPVVTESFSQWVIEDDFAGDRPPLERVGVQFVDNISAHELTKKRLLNGVHCALGYLGTLAGHRTTAEVLADPVFAAFVGGFIDEVSALLPPAAGLDLDDYKASLLDRLSNPAMADQLARLCRRGSTKMPAYLLPSVNDAIAADRPHPLLTLAVAGWFRYLQGCDDLRSSIEVVDPMATTLRRLAARGGTDPRPLLGSHASLQQLGQHPAFVADLEQACEALTSGARQAIVQQLTVGARR